MRMRWLAAAFALVLCGCAFSSATPLFAVSEATHPFADGERVLWTETGDDDELDIIFDRVGAAYELTRIGEDDDERMNVLFVEVEATPEQDYIAQVRFRPDEEAVAYAFMWRDGAGYRVFTDPRGFAESDVVEDHAKGLCQPQPYGECAFRRRADVLAYYQRIIYPAFVAGAGAGAPARFIELTPYADPGVAAPETP